METYAIEGITDEYTDFTEKQFFSKKIENDILSDTSALWIAKCKGNPVGVVQVEYQKDIPNEHYSAPEINKLYILRNFCGIGIGQKLMQLAENHLRSKGFDKAWLWVLASNDRAVHFYKKQGYNTIGTAYFQMDTNRYNNKVMIKKL